MASLKHKRFIFTVTTGRSGSNFLTEVLACLKDTCSVHEPRPRFDKVMRMTQGYPIVAEEFLAKKKIPAMEKKLKNKSIYAESSHLICKGFLEAWLKIDGVSTPDLICLDRDLRKISRSLLQLGTTPGRTFQGLKYYLAPNDPDNLTLIEDHGSLHDYQVCYWYCLEIEARKKHYKALIEKHGGKCVHTSIDELKTEKGIEAVRKKLSLPAFSFFGKRRYQRIINQVINPRSKEKSHLNITEEQIIAWEKELEDRIIYKV
jgi:hypothetical protein